MGCEERNSIELLESTFGDEVCLTGASQEQKRKGIGRRVTDLGLTIVSTILKMKL